MYSKARTTELNERITALLKKLDAIECDKRIKSVAGRQNAIKRVCQAEMSFWREYLGISEVKDESGLAQSVEGSVSTLHGYLSDIRKAIADHFEGRLNEGNSYTAEMGKIGHRRIERRHLALSVLVKSFVEKQARKESATAAVWAKLSDRQRVSRSAILAVARRLLGSESYISIALGLIAVTGRRPIEILYTGDFGEIDDERVFFTGQAKTRGAENSSDDYAIPTLISASEVIAAFSKLRSKKDFSYLDDGSKTPEEINRIVSRKTAPEIHSQMKKHFSKVFDNPQAKSLRAIYAQALWDMSGGDNDDIPSESQQVFFSQVLGHSVGDYVTASSYMGFITNP